MEFWKYITISTICGTVETIAKAIIKNKSDNHGEVIISPSSAKVTETVVTVSDDKTISTTTEKIVDTTNENVENNEEEKEMKKGNVIKNIGLVLGGAAVATAATVAVIKVIENRETICDTITDTADTAVDSLIERI